MSSTKYAMVALRAMLLMMWTATAAATAAVATLPKSELDPWLILWTAIVSVLSGGTALAYRLNATLMKREEEGNTNGLTRPWLYVGAHMGGSLMAGFAGFLIVRTQPQLDVSYQLLAVLLASFGGATWLEKRAEKWLPEIPAAKPNAEN